MVLLRQIVHIGLCCCGGITHGRSNVAYGRVDGTDRILHLIYLIIQILRFYIRLRLTDNSSYIFSSVDFPFIVAVDDFSTLASGNSTHVITRVCKTDFSLIDAFTDNSSRNTHNSAHIIPVYYTPCEI